MATREDVNYYQKVVENGKLLPEAEGREQQFPRSSQLPRDNGLTDPQVAMK